MCLALRLGGGIDVDGDETVLDDPSWPAGEAGAGSARTDAGPMDLASCGRCASGDMCRGEGVVDLIGLLRSAGSSRPRGS